MNERSPEDLCSIALDPSLPDDMRQGAIANLARVHTRDAVDALLILAGRQEESDELLEGAGAVLAALAHGGVAVSEWDLRNLTTPAAKAFFSEGAPRG